MACWVLRTINPKDWTWKRLGESLGCNAETAKREYQNFMIALNDGQVRLPGTDMLLANYVYPQEGAGRTPLSIMYENLSLLNDKLAQATKAADFATLIRAKTTLAAEMAKIAPDPLKKITLDEVISIIYLVLKDEPHEVRTRILNGIGLRVREAIAQFWKSSNVGSG